MLAALDSPFCVSYRDAFLDVSTATLHIVMEYVPGGTLHELITAARAPLPEDFIWRVAIQLALGLRHMHAKRVLHRDI